MEKRFATQLTQLFSQPYSPDSKLDLVCRLACKAMRASSASILLYCGEKDELQCKGRYIRAEAVEIDEKNNSNLGKILKNICACEFLHASEKKIDAEKIDDLYAEYMEDICPEDAIPENDFLELSNQIHQWKNDYEKLLATYQGEKYSIAKDTEFITGQRYKQILLKKKVYHPDVLVKNLDDVEDKKKYYCMNYLEEKLRLKFNPKYYTAFPLFAGGRYFGILRFLFPGKEEALFKDQDNRLTLDEHHKEKCLDITQKISFHLESNYFLSGYKDTILTSKKYARRQEPLGKFLDAQCDSLSRVIRSRGALIRRWDEEKGFYDVDGYSQGLNEYIGRTQGEAPTFFNALSEKFKREGLLGAFFNTGEYPFDVTKFIFYKEDGSLTYERAKWEIEDLKDSEFLITLNELGLSNIAVFPLTRDLNYFIIFLNSVNREFLEKDIEMIYPALKNIGHELDAREYVRTVEERMNAVNDMHGDLSKAIDKKDCNAYEYVIDFLNIVSGTIKRLGIFSHHIQWEYVSEVLPKGTPKDQYVLRDITPKEFDLNPFNIKRKDYRELKLNNSDFSSKVLRYFYHGCLKPLFKFSPEKDHLHFDLPFFAENESNVTSDSKLIGIITLIYKQEDEAQVNTNEFFNFMRFFSNQLSLAWRQFQEGIAAKIQGKIDRAIKFGKKEKIHSQKEELVVKSKILADEFHGDLCCFYLVNAQDETLKLEASNIPIEEDTDITYNLNEDSKSLSVISYKKNKNIRIFGRKRLEELVNEEKLKRIEDAVKAKILEEYKEKHPNYTGILTEHWLSVVIAIGKKKLGLIRLFRIKGLDSLTDEKRFGKVTPPFSEFETSLLSRIQEHIFNIILSHQNIQQNIQQRMEDVKDALSQVNAPLKLLQGHSINITSGVVPKEKVWGKLFHINILAKMAFNYAVNFQRIVDLDKGAKDNIKLDKEIIYDLKKYLIGLSIDFKPLSQMKFIHVCVTDTLNNLSLEVDKDLFDQAMMNLIENALQYSFKPEERNKLGLNGKPPTPEDKENVLVKAEETNGDIVITISNYGIEVSGKEKKEIFKRNFRGTEASDRITLGTGSGLFLAKEIIKLHNGDIELVSGTPKYNTVFRITLPKGRVEKSKKRGKYS